MRKAGFHTTHGHPGERGGQRGEAEIEARTLGRGRSLTPVGGV